ncbi:hypothetical protein KJ708_12605 [bacterium]|nr:hypothetical protein [bacterium]MBU1917999.1 hypothetical protein [bacterium]
MVNPADFDKKLPPCPLDEQGKPDTHDLVDLGKKSDGSAIEKEVALKEIDEKYDALTGDDDYLFQNVCEDTEGNVYYNWDNEDSQSLQYALDAQSPNIAGTGQFVSATESLFDPANLHGMDNTEALLTELAALRDVQEDMAQSEQQRRISQLKGDILGTTIKINQLEVDIHTIPSAIEYTKTRMEEMEKSLTGIHRPTNQFLFECLMSSFLFGFVVPLFEDIGKTALVADKAMGQFSLGIHKIYKMVRQDQLLRSQPCAGGLPPRQLRAGKGAIRHIMNLLVGYGLLTGGNKLIDSLRSNAPGAPTTSSRNNIKLTEIPDVEQGERTNQEYETYLLGLLNDLQSKEISLMAEVTPLREQKILMDQDFQALNHEMILTLNPNDYDYDPELQQQIIALQNLDEFTWSDRLLQTDMGGGFSHVTSVGIGFGVGTKIAHGFYSPYISPNVFGSIHRGMDSLEMELRADVLLQCSAEPGDKSDSKKANEKGATATEPVGEPEGEPVEIPETESPAEYAATDPFLEPYNFVAYPFMSPPGGFGLRLPKLNFDLGLGPQPAYAMGSGSAYYASAPTGTQSTPFSWSLYEGIEGGSKPSLGRGGKAASGATKPRGPSAGTFLALGGLYIGAEIAHTAFDSPEWARRTTDAGLIGTAVYLTPASQLLPSLAPGIGGGLMFGEASRTLTHETDWHPLVETGIETTAEVGGFFAGAAVTSAATGYVCAELGIAVTTLGGTLVGTGVGAVVGLALLGGYALFRHYNKQQAFNDWREDFLDKVPEFFQSDNNPDLAYKIKSKFNSIEQTLMDMDNNVNTEEELAQLKAIYDELQREKTLPDDQQYTTIALAFMGDYLHARYFKKMKAGGALQSRAQTVQGYLHDIRFPGLSNMCTRVQDVLRDGSHTRKNRDQTYQELKDLVFTSNDYERLMFQKCGDTIIEDYIQPWMEKAYQHEDSLRTQEMHLSQAERNDSAIDFITLSTSVLEIGNYLRDPNGFLQEEEEASLAYQELHTRMLGRSDPASIDTFRDFASDIISRGDPDEIKLLIYDMHLPHAQEQMLLGMCDYLNPQQLTEAITDSSVDQGQHVQKPQPSQKPRIEKPNKTKLLALETYAENSLYNPMRTLHRHNPWGPVGEHFLDTFRVNFIHELDLKFLEIDQSLPNEAPDHKATWIKLKMLKLWMEDVVLYLNENGVKESDFGLDPEDMDRWSKTFGRLETIQTLIDSYERTGDNDLLGSPRSQNKDCIFKLMIKLGQAMQDL